MWLLLLLLLDLSYQRSSSFIVRFTNELRNEVSLRKVGWCSGLEWDLTWHRMCRTLEATKSALPTSFDTLIWHLTTFLKGGSGRGSVCTSVRRGWVVRSPESDNVHHYFRRTGLLFRSPRRLDEVKGNTSPINRRQRSDETMSEGVEGDEEWGT